MSTHSGPTAPTQAQLSAEVLSLDDLPPGWSVPPPSSSISVGQPACFTKAERTSEAAVDKSVSFAKGQLPSVTEDLGYYPGSTAASSFAASTAALDSCHAVTFTVDGASLSGTVQPRAAATLGDGSRAYSVVLTGYGYTLSLGISVVRSGQLVMVVVYANQGSLDTTAFANVTKLGYDKL